MITFIFILFSLLESHIRLDYKCSHSSIKSSQIHPKFLLYYIVNIIALCTPAVYKYAHVNSNRVMPCNIMVYYNLQYTG